MRLTEHVQHEVYQIEGNPSKRAPSNFFLATLHINQNVTSNWPSSVYEERS